MVKFTISFTERGPGAVRSRMDTESEGSTELERNLAAFAQQALLKILAATAGKSFFGEGKTDAEALQNLEADYALKEKKGIDC